MRISHILPKLLSSSKLWSPVFKEADNVVGGPLETRIKQFKNRHNIDAIVPVSRTEIKALDISDDFNATEIVKHFADLLGYHYSVVSSDPNNFVRFVLEATRLIPFAGTNAFVNFMSYLLNTPIEVVPLWYDPDRSSFYTIDDPFIVNRRIVLDGESPTHNVYPTPYVRLKILKGKEIDTQEFVSLFNSISPADMIIHEVAFTYRSQPIEINFNHAIQAYKASVAQLATT